MPTSSSDKSFSYINNPSFRRFTELTLEEAKEFGEYRILPVSSIIEDPDNKPLYGDYKTEGLAMSIRENGFQGAILVYPFQNSYRLQSGHRSLEAAKAAGLTEIPAIISQAPHDEIERRKNLIIPNTHERYKSPMCMARMVQYHFDTLKIEKDQETDSSKKNTINLTEKVAADLEISTSQVTKYRSLLKLIRPLQDLAESETVSWSALSAAAAYDPSIQEAVYKRVLGRIKSHGSDSLTRKWILDEINECKHIIPTQAAYRFDRNDLSMLEFSLREKFEEETAQGKRYRRSDGTKAIKKSLELLKLAFSRDALIKTEDYHDVYRTLIDIRELIRNNIKDFE